jgi:hypothetical protein
MNISKTAAQGRYKAHPCPACGVVHKGKGPFCSKSCSNTGRDAEYREKMSNKMLHTDEGQLRTWNFKWGDEFEPILPGTTPVLSSNQFVADGDVWTNE